MNLTFIETLREYVSSLESNPLTDDESSLCVTVDGESKAIGRPFWMQFHAGQINFPHIDSAEKDAVLGTIFDAIDELGDVELEPGEYVSFTIGDLGTEVVDRLIIEALKDYFEADSEMQLTTTTL